MKKEFFEFFGFTNAELKALWKNGIFVFDANILINLYRYSEGTKDKFIEVIEKLDDRVWFANQSIKEYLTNRVGEIQKQKELYALAIKDIERLEELFDHERQHPFLSSKMLQKIKKVNKEVNMELTKGKEFQDKRINKDDIRDKLAKITKGKIGSGFSEEELLEIYKEGEKRYNKKIPPGYKDIAKIAANDGSAYGDLVIWKEVIEFAKEKKKDIIFITDDQKEDWWFISNKQTISPRPELIKEFRLLTNQKIHFYKPSPFLKFVGEFLQSEVKEEVLQEVKDSATRSYRYRTFKGKDSIYSIKKGLNYKNPHYNSEANSSFYTKSGRAKALSDVREKLERLISRRANLALQLTHENDNEPEILATIKELDDRIGQLRIIESVYVDSDNNS